MTDKNLAKVDPATAIDVMSSVITKGDLDKLSDAERLQYYIETCKSLGLNPLTKPLDYIKLNGKTTLYTTKTATDQLRQIHNVSIEIVGRERVDDVYVVTAQATTPDGRTDTEIGAVTIGNQKGDALANALMKATTKAKRRATLSICGLGWLDETEIETVPTARPMRVDVETGEILTPAVLPAAPAAARLKRAAAVVAEPAMTDEQFRAYAKANGVTTTALYLDVVGVPVPADPAEAYRLLKERLDAIEAEQAEQEEMFDLVPAADPDRHTA